MMTGVSLEVTEVMCVAAGVGAGNEVRKAVLVPSSVVRLVGQWR
jgi:hypothetical protein